MRVTVFSFGIGWTSRYFPATQRCSSRYLFLLTFFISALYSIAAQPLSVSWSNNLLTVSDSRLPDGKLEIWYLEAFCRSGAAGRDWNQTTLKHKTTLVRSKPDHLQFQTLVEPQIEVHHDIWAKSDNLQLTFELRNLGRTNVDLQWFEPACIRVAGFTGSDQTNYTGRSFIFTSNGLTTLDRLRRTTDARYIGGQVYLPDWVRPSDSNPRPVCLDHPVNGLIGCFSADGHWILATASDHTHELFEGVYVCLHSDPALSGLAPGQTKKIRSKIYLLPNDPQTLLARYKKDFPRREDRW